MRNAQKAAVPVSGDADPIPTSTRNTLKGNGQKDQTNTPQPK